MIRFKLTQRRFNIWFTVTMLLVLIYLFVGANLPIKPEYTHDELVIRIVLCASLIASTITLSILLTIGRQESPE